MKGIDFLMQKYNIIKKTRDKAIFIADNMELEYDSIDYDGVILFIVRVDKTIYSVSDHEGNSVFFEQYYEADNYRTDLTEVLKLKEDCNSNVMLTIRLTKNHLSFRDIIRGDDIDIFSLEDLFDDNVFDDVELITKTEIALCDGTVKVTFVDERGGE